MKILVKDSDQNIIYNPTQDFKTDLGWTDSAIQMEREILEQIINPIENYDTARYKHETYQSDKFGINQDDIWFYFYFLDTTNDYTNGLSFTHAGFSYPVLSKALAQSVRSFFRLEFYKTPNDDAPTNANRRLVFAKNLSLALGEKTYISILKDTVPVPVYNGSSMRNKENMFLFWFVDDSAFDETTITGNTFYMTAKFYNAEDGSIVDFTNKELLSTELANESEDLYFKVIIDRTDFTYTVYDFDGSIGDRVGLTSNPIKFYERRT